jgi:membrane protein DedA with SNARE-associated domain
MGALGALSAASSPTTPAVVLASVGTWLEHFHGPGAYVLCGLLVFGEAAVLLGFVVPGETAALAGGVLASLQHANLELMLVVIVGGAIAGDSVGYEVGKLIGPFLLEHRPLRGHAGVRRGEELLARYGGPAVFLGRWVALARALVPGLSGMSAMRYRTFLFYNAIGGVVWGTTFVMIGYAAGTSYTAVARTVGTFSFVIVGVVVLAVVAYVMVRRRRERRQWGPPPSPGAEPEASPGEEVP